MINDKQQMGQLLKAQFGDLTKIENFKNALCRHEMRIPANSIASGTRSPKSSTTVALEIPDEEILPRRKSIAGRRQRSFKKSKTFKRESPYALVSLKDKLDHFYHAYNKSLVFEDGMEFSDEEGDKMNATQDFSPLSPNPCRPSKRWSVLQKFICQNNEERFKNNIEDIAKEIRLPTPTNLKRKKLGRFKRQKQAIATPVQTSLAPIIVIPCSKNLKKEINSKIFSPVSKNSRRLIEEAEEHIQVKDEDNTDECPTEDTHQSDKTLGVEKIKLMNIFGAFCKRKRARKHHINNFPSARNCSFVRPVTHTLEPVKISAPHHMEGSVATPRHILGKGLSYKLDFSDRRLSTLDSSFRLPNLSFNENSPTLIFESGNLTCKVGSIRQRGRNHQRLYESADNYFNEGDVTSKSVHKTSVFHTSVHIPPILPHNKVLDHTYRKDESEGGLKATKHKKKNFRVKFALKDLKNKNLCDIRLQKQTRSS